MLSENTNIHFILNCFSLPGEILHGVPCCHFCDINSKGEMPSVTSNYTFVIVSRGRDNTVPRRIF